MTYAYAKLATVHLEAIGFAAKLDLADLEIAANPLGAGRSHHLAVAGAVPLVVGVCVAGEAGLGPDECRLGGGERNEGEHEPRRESEPRKGFTFI